MKKIIMAALFALAAPIAIHAQKFAHFDSNAVVSALPEYTTVQNELQTLGKQYEDDLKRTQEEFQKKHDEYEKVRETLLENMRQRREQELQDLAQRYEQMRQDYSESFQKAQAEKIKALTDKVQAAVKTVAETGGYVYVFDTSMAESMGVNLPFFINTKLSTDITADVKKALGV